MNKNKAKYKLQTNSSLYIARNKGGCGIRSLEMSYVCTKIKTAIKIIHDNDPKMVLVRKFDLIRMAKRRKSFIKDAIQFSKNIFNAQLNVIDHAFTFEFSRGESKVVYRIIMKLPNI